MNWMAIMLGTACVQITSAEPLALMCTLAGEKYTLYDIGQNDPLTITVQILARDYRRFCDYLDKFGYQYSVIQKTGAYWFWPSIVNRGWLIGGLMLILIATVLIPTRIFFVKVAGAENLSEKYILEQAMTCGVTFGASRKQVRSEKIKNALLEAVPELQWAGINTSGCVATIQVREKNTAEEPENAMRIGNVIAERDGMIYSCTVEKGYPLCHVGQAVQKGQVLVSGYQDLGLFVTASPVKADIYALTQRTVCTITPTKYQTRINETKEFCKYNIQVGKNIIKLYKDSGIYDGSCVKMYEEYYISVPGGFYLPVAIVKEQVFYNDILDAQETDLKCFDWLNGCTESYIIQQMIAGQILHENTDVEMLGPVCVQYGKYACVEMIGKNISEETVEKYGKNY